MGNLVRGALQQFVARDVVATTCIVDAYRTWTFRIVWPIPVTLCKQPQPLGLLQQHLD